MAFLSLAGQHRCGNKHVFYAWLHVLNAHWACDLKNMIVIVDWDGFNVHSLTARVCLWPDNRFSVDALWDVGQRARLVQPMMVWTADVQCIMGIGPLSRNIYGMCRPLHCCCFKFLLNVESYQSVVFTPVSRNACSITLLLLVTMGHNKTHYSNGE